jgi:hypothetical protein
MTSYERDGVAYMSQPAYYKSIVHEMYAAGNQHTPALIPAMVFANRSDHGCRRATPHWTRNVPIPGEDMLSFDKSRCSSSIRLWLHIASDIDGECFETFMITESIFEDRLKSRGEINTPEPKAMWAGCNRTLDEDMISTQNLSSARYKLRLPKFTTPIF